MLGVLSSWCATLPLLLDEAPPHYVWPVTSLALSFPTVLATMLLCTLAHPVLSSYRQHGAR
ncbi:hypothetical protein EON67_02095 [archaeon]|nr:MAG: hypothetical protein EON67_02095 [archaeon]